MQVDTATHFYPYKAIQWRAPVFACVYVWVSRGNQLPWGRGGDGGVEQRNGWGTRGNLWGHWTGLFDGHEREGGRKELKHRGRVGEGVGGDMRNITPDVCDCDHCEDVGEELKCRFVHLLLLCVCVCTLCDNCSFRFRPDEREKV